MTTAEAEVLDQLQQNLELASGKKLEIRLNENRINVLSIKWGKCTRISLHRFFLKAPPEVMDSLAHCLKRGERKIAPKIRWFIEESVKELDYSSRVNRTKLVTQGEIYDLEEMYTTINREHFSSELDLAITWYGRIGRKPRTQLNFGLYHDPLKLVKIHRMLDSYFVPEYFVRYVVYHEMLHAVCRPYHDERGMHRIHTPEFKKREKAYPDYERAVQWSKQNRDHFFH